MRVPAVHHMLNWLKVRGIPRHFQRTLSCVIETDTWVTLKSLMKLITSNDTYHFSVLAKIILFPYAPDSAVYESCPNKECKKKVTQDDNDYSYHCEKCQTVGRSFTVRYKLLVSTYFESDLRHMYKINLMSKQISDWRFPLLILKCSPCRRISVTAQGTSSWYFLMASRTTCWGSTPHRSRTKLTKGKLKNSIRFWTNVWASKCDFVYAANGCLNRSVSS